MRVCLCTISYREKLLDVALEAAARIGFEAVELWGREPHLAEEYDESRVKGIRTLLDEHGLQVAALGSYHYFGKTVHKEDSVTLADTLHTAHGLKTPIVRVWASDVSSAKATPEVWEQTVAAAQEACDRAAKMNVIFAAEMHDNTLADTAKSALRLVEEINRPNFRLNFQVSTNLTEDQFVRLETVLPYVVHVHCQNYVKGTGHEPYKRITMGEGVFDYRELMARLNEADYRGHVGIEFAAEEGAGKEASLKKDLDFLCSL
jgi:3-dehydroshikimate dehydratase